MYRHRVNFGSPRRASGVIADFERQSEEIVPIPESLGAGYGGVAPSHDGREVVVSTLRRWSDWGELWVLRTEGGSPCRLEEPFGESYPLAWPGAGERYLENYRVVLTDFGPRHAELWRARDLSHMPKFVVRLPEGCEQTDVAIGGARAVCVSRRTESDVSLARDFDSEVE